MLTDTQRERIQQGFNIGFTDRHIAKAVADVTHRQVYYLRHLLGIPSSAVMRRRHDIWVHLIYAGMPLAHISKIYEVTEESIKVTLWKRKKLSLVDVKSGLQAVRDKMPMGAIADSKLPNFDGYGLPEKLLRKPSKRR